MVEYYIDSANMDEIGEIVGAGLVQGCTTNGSIVKKENRKYTDIARDIIKNFPQLYHLSVEPIFDENDLDKAKKDILTFYEIDPTRIVIKLPPTLAGLNVCRWCKNNKIKTNITAIVKPVQAELATLAGATYISVFWGRIGDTGLNPSLILSSITNAKFNPYIIVGSIRGGNDVTGAKFSDPHIITIPHKVFKNFTNNPKSLEVIQEFNRAIIEKEKQ